MSERPDAAESQPPPDETPPVDPDQPIQGDETEYIERGLTDEDKESR